MGIIIKIINWIRMNGAAILGGIQLVIKAGKELITAVIDLISIIMPVNWAQGLIDKVRAICEKIDGVIEKIKAWLLKL